MEIKMEKCIAQQKSDQRNEIILSRWKTNIVKDDTDKKNSEIEELTIFYKLYEYVHLI